MSFLDKDLPGLLPVETWLYAKTHVLLILYVETGFVKRYVSVDWHLVIFFVKRYMYVCVNVSHF